MTFSTLSHPRYPVSEVALIISVLALIISLITSFISFRAALRRDNFDASVRLSSTISESHRRFCKAQNLVDQKTEMSELLNLMETLAFLINKKVMPSKPRIFFTQYLRDFISGFRKDSASSAIFLDFTSSHDSFSEIKLFEAKMKIKN